MFLVGMRKPKYPEETQADTRRTCETLYSNMNPRTVPTVSLCSSATTAKTKSDPYVACLDFQVESFLTDTPSPGFISKLTSR